MTTGQTIIQSNIKKTIDIKNLVRSISQNYEFKILKNDNLSVKQYDEGYMNTCLNLTFPKSNVSIIAVIYNVNKYSGIKAENQLNNAYSAAQYLSENGIPSRIPFKSKKNKSLIEIYPYPNSQPHLLGIYNYLPGKTVPWEAYTRRHLKSLGLVMRDMHKIWKTVQPELTILHWKQYLKKDSDRLLKYISTNASPIEKKLGIKIDVEKISEIANQITFLEKENQLIHYDLVRGNVLFSERKKHSVYEVSGIIDFEKVMYAPVEIDLARTLSFLLVDCKYKTDKQVIFHFLDQGYNQNNEKHKLITRDLEKAMIYFWLRDLWKFLTNNPYESLNRNYHYNETKKRLIKSEIINQS